MSSAARTLALVALLVLGAIATPATAGTAPPTDGPRIVAAYPNPVAENDRGEFVVLRVPPETDLGTLTLGDGEDRASLPNGTVGGRIVLTEAPGRVPNGTEGRVVAVEGSRRSRTRARRSRSDGGIGRSLRSGTTTPRRPNSGGGRAGGGRSARSNSPSGTRGEDGRRRSCSPTRPV